MSLGAPLALLALLALAAVVGAALYERRRHARTEALYAGSPSLRRGRSPLRARLRLALLLAAAALIAFAVARPQWGGTENPLQRRGIDVAIALDVSRSMSATDVEPSRAAAAAAGLEDMLSHLRGDRVGLVTFGGSAFARSPLTLDFEAVAFLVNRAQLEGALVEPGTDLGEAIETALRLLDVPDSAQTQAIVLISDGENLGQELDAAIKAARDRDVRIYTVAVGTNEGAAVPARSTPAARQATPPAGESALSRTDRATLGRIAEATGGETRELGGIAGLAVEFARLQQTSFAEETERIPVERFQWFLGAALVLLLLQWAIGEGRRVSTPLAPGRRGASSATIAIGSLLIGLWLIGCGGTAAYQQVAEGNAAYEDARYEDALAAYAAAKELLPDDPIVDYNIGNTLNRLQRYDEATMTSREAARLANLTGDSRVYTRALYSAGNHALQQDALEEARDAYIEVLLRDPEDDDARHNLELVLRILRPPGQQPPPGTTPTPAPPGGTPDASATAGPNGPGQPGGSPTPGAGQPGASATPQPGATPGATPGAAGTPGAPGAPGQPGEGGGGEESLSELLDNLLADGVSIEEALQFLDRLRRESEAANLQPRVPGGGGLADR